MAVSRNLVHIDTPKDEPGFLGSGHIARPVIRRSFAETDPFILLMDDMLDKKDEVPVGGPHPHAGFETVTLMLEGELGLGAHSMRPGDMQLMTAGSGIVHTETIDKAIKMRLLQLWVSLPKKDRWITPRVQDISLEHVPQLDKDGVSIRLYSGEMAGLVSPVQNYTPMILADVHLQPGVSSTLQVPANYNGFIYMLQGGAEVGTERQLLQQDQVGWLDVFSDEAVTDLQLSAGYEGARFVLYAGKPTGDPIVSHGPFIGDTSQDIIRLYHEYNQGKMQHITSVPEEQQMVF